MTKSQDGKQEFTKDDFNKLSEWLAIRGTTEIFDVLRKLGFTDVGSVIHYLEDRVIEGEIVIKFSHEQTSTLKKLLTSFSTQNLNSDILKEIRNKL